MNIYIDVESHQRIGCKTTAVLAASKDHKVIVSHLTEIMIGIRVVHLLRNISSYLISSSSERIRRHKL